MSGEKAQKPRRLRMAIRIYLFGLLLLGLSAIAIAVVGRLFVAPLVKNPDQTISPWIVEHIVPYRSDPERFRQELERLGATLRVDVSFYDDKNNLVASNVTPPMPAVSWDVFERLSWDDLVYPDGPPGPGRGPGRQHAVAVREGGRLVGYALIKPPSRPEPPPLSRAWFVLGFLLILLGVLSAPLARSIVKPLEQLGEAARAFGEGNVSVRTGIERNDEIGDLARTFDEMADRVTALLRAEKELVANVSHELRTPLARIRVVLEIAGEADPAKVRRYLGEIAEDLAELERLVDDVLAMARLDVAAAKPSEGSQLAMHLSPTGPDSIAKKAAEKFQSRFPARELILSMDDDLPTIDADASLLRRVIDNLLDNARKYSEDGTKIELSARRAEGGVSFEVKDQGIGIEEADLPLVFQAFFRTDRSRARKTGGTGLGLALARGIVEAHGGRIEIESQVGVGTTARFFVPAADEEAAA